MNTSLPMTFTTPRDETTRRPAFNLQTFVHTVFGLFAAQDDPAALRYMLIKNGESVD
jgi:hypothetical protein